MSDGSITGRAKALFGFSDVEPESDVVAEPDRSLRAPQVPASPEPEQEEQDTPEPADPLRGRLQRELDQGVALEQRLRNPLDAMGAAVFAGRRTTAEDVDVWEARVARLLRDRPRTLSLFRYEEPENPLLGLATNPFEGQLGRRLRNRVAQLETIIKDL